jgi:four helix bundle protein
VSRQIRSFRDLEVWELGKRLALLSYELSRSFPNDEIYGLTSQIGRAAVSVPGNIAEGFGVH